MSDSLAVTVAMESLEVGSLSSLVEELPRRIEILHQKLILIDFGKVSFGNLLFCCPPGFSGTLKFHFGEDSCEGRINRCPPGSVRYASTEITFADHGGCWIVAPDPDTRNTGPQAVPTPPEWKVVLPFRWVEIEGVDEMPNPDTIFVCRRSFYLSNWNDKAAGFESSNPCLDSVWELCRYSIKATTFAGIYVDGDRERIPYEADAYLNQISHYACDPHPEIARVTFDWLMKAPTWPTEWAAHMVFMAHADWMFTGDHSWLKERYEDLKQKLLPNRVRHDGLIASTPDQIKLDLVDWPPGERDNFEFTEANTVVNAFQYRALVLMAELAGALKKEEESKLYRERAALLFGIFQETFYDRNKGIYVDGEGSRHASLHANLFSLAFGLVPLSHQLKVIAFLKTKGMACSVYAAQYLLEALFEAGEDTYAMDLILGPGDRSWRHMLSSGTTLTWEAWDQSYKPNQDWNHAWGAAPANLLPRFVLGVRPLEPGFRKVEILPRLGPLAWAKGTVPTVLGPLQVDVSRGISGEIVINAKGPEGMKIVY